jgi:rhamnulokinase
MRARPVLIAVDFGAESARVMAATLSDERLTLHELHRFPTRHLQGSDGVPRWDLGFLLQQTETALRLLAERNDLEAVSIGVDTWGVDFALCPPDTLPNFDNWPACYRASRNAAAMQEVLARVDRRRIYDLTGIQFLPFNSVYQLYAKLQACPLSDRPDGLRLRFIPDLIHQHLCGSQKSEYSIATTSQLFNPRSRGWERGMLDAVGAPPDLMQPIAMPGDCLGDLSQGLRSRLGLGKLKVVAVATHDTGSAFAAAPVTQPNAAIISSGTWSLVGVERAEPIISDQSYAANLTNEGSADGGFRVLKNVAGMWPLQQCRRAWWPSDAPDYAEVIALADGAPRFGALFDPNHPSLLNPPDMPAAIAALVSKYGQTTPGSRSAFVRAILESLAFAYKAVIDQLNEVLPEPISVIHIIGGGCRNARLNQWTANATGLPVLAGPVEATALGNALVQAVRAGWAEDLKRARVLLTKSVSLHEYEPHDKDAWQDAYERYQAIVTQP